MANPESRDLTERAERLDWGLRSKRKIGPGRGPVNAENCE